MLDRPVAVGMAVSRVKVLGLRVFVASCKESGETV